MLAPGSGILHQSAQNADPFGQEAAAAIPYAVGHVSPDPTRAASALRLAQSASLSMSHWSLPGMVRKSCAFGHLLPLTVLLAELRSRHWNRQRSLSCMGFARGRRPQPPRTCGVGQTISGHSINDKRAGHERTSDQPSSQSGFPESCFNLCQS